MRSAYVVMMLCLSACGRGGLVHGTAAGGAGGHPQAQGPDASGSGDTRPARPSCTFKGFADPVPYMPSAAPYSLRVADVTGDGHLDILVAESSNRVRSLELFTNTGRGGFSQSGLTIAIQPNSGNLLAADFNGDRIIDLASQSNSASGIDLGAGDGVLAFDFGTAPGKFASQPVTLPSPQTTGFLTVGDFDGDGRLDIAFAGYDYVTMGGFMTDAGGLVLPGHEPTHFA